MTKDEALKLALEALEKHAELGLLAGATITAIREALAQPEQGPVAWLHTKIEGVAVPHRPADLDKHPDRWEALYKTPPPCPTCEALARTVMLDQTSHDTTPPQPEPVIDKSAAVRIATSLGWEPKRTWVGLTDEDKQIAFDDTQEASGGFWEFADAIEAKLKEKNT